MKFLLDAHLPPSLAVLLGQAGHHAIQTLDLLAQNLTSDADINEISVRDRHVVVTKDNDFFYSLVLHRRPWKLLLVKTGNIGAKDLCALFARNLSEIVAALETHTLVELDRSAVTAIRVDTAD